MPKDCVIRCANCAWFRLQEDDFGRCHRYPPIMVMEAEQYSFDCPTVNEEDFCGEFQGKQ